MNATALAGLRQMSTPQTPSGLARMMATALAAGIIVASCGGGGGRGVSEDYSGPEISYDSYGRDNYDPHYGSPEPCEHCNK